ncbi:MAG: CHAD domain-containing protein [Chitinophagaceae bacterium]|nr:CHAD domain-containing protein [Chitinophagaceae bacterium]
MKRAAITKVIEKRFDAINTHSLLIAEHFGSEAIHEFRVEIKKLNAFFSLLYMANPGATPLMLQPQLKVFYDLLGELRNAQLQQELIVARCHSNSIALPNAYLQFLQEQYALLQQHAAEHAPNIQHVKKLLLKKLPLQVKNKALLHYRSYKWGRLQQLVSYPPFDETLHEIRKLCKEVLYNTKHIKKAGKDADESYFNNQEFIENLQQKLGDNHDLYTSLYMIWHYLLGCPDTIDKNSLELIEKHLLQEKYRLKPSIKTYLQNISSLA